jgi:selenocysteine lyase/cysteine desulfurase
VSLDLKASGTDFYTSGPLKWLCGGPGLSYLYVRPQVLPELHPRIAGWLGAKNAFEFDFRQYEPHDGARRLEMGTPALPTVHTALGGQEIVDEVGIQAIEDRNRALVTRLADGCRERDFHLTIAGNPRDRSAIVMIKHADPPGVVAHLAENGIIVDHRPGHVRASPHFYNTEEDVDRFLQVLGSFPG